MGAETVPVHWLALRNLFLLLDCFVQPELRGRFLILWQLIDHALLKAMGACFFLSDYKGGVDGEGRKKERNGMEREEKGEAAVWVSNK